MRGIVGRAEEIKRLQAATDRATAGRTSTVLLSGEAGIGKSTLLAAVAAMAASAGFTVARGSGDELETERPFGPWVAALDLDPRSSDPERRDLAALLTAASSQGTRSIADQVADRRYQVVDAMAALVDRLATTGPLALVLDDLQWADHSTAVVLRRLSGLAGLPLLIVAARRPHSGPVEEILGQMGHLEVEDLRIAPLTAAEVQALVRERTQATPTGRLTKMAAGAAGNPLLLTELMSSLEASGALIAEGGRVDTAADASVSDLGRRIRLQAARLGATAQGVVQVAAVLGGRFTLDEIAETGGWAVGDLLEPLAELEQVGLLVERDGALGFRHDLIRSSVEDDIAPAARRALHAAAGRARARRGSPAARVARHLALGAEAGDRQAVEWLARAAAEAAPQAPSAAVELLDDALRLVAPDDAAARHPLLVARVEALGWAGRNDEAEAGARSLIASTADPDRRSVLRRQLALSLFLQNRAAEAALECRASAAELSDQPGPHAQALGEAGLSHMGAAQLDEAEAAADAAIAGGRAHGHPMATCVGLAVRSRLAAFRGDLHESLAAAREAVAAATQDPTGEAHRYQPGIFEAMTLLDLDQLDEARAVVQRERLLAGDRGVVWAVPMYHAADATRHLFTGDLASSATEAEAGLGVIEDGGARLAEVWCHANLALVALHRGDEATAAIHIEAGDEAARTGTPLLGTDMHALAQVRLAEQRRDLPTAALLALGSWQLFDALAITGGTRQMLGMDTARLAALTGDGDGLALVADGLDELADGTGLAADRGAARFAAGLRDEDPDALVESVALLGESPHRLRRALAAEAAARAVWAAGDPVHASRLLVDARQTYLDAGALGDARRAAAVFTALGLKRPSGGRRPTEGWESLTTTERRVAELVATGATNREAADRLGISRRTVETHLRHIYGKLGVPSRVALAVATLRAAETSPAG